MCGVIGYYSKNPKKEHVDMVKRLFWESKIRGLHAFGFSAMMSDFTLITIKSHNLDRLLDALESLSLPLALIGHCRYSTSGNWLDHANNQPIEIEKDRGVLSLVFNGVISMSTKEQNEETYGPLETENDGEIFLRKVLEGEDWSEWVHKGKFSFAGLFFEGNDVTMIRNAQRPLYFWNELKGSVFVASTKDIFKRALGAERPVLVPTTMPIRLSQVTL